MFPFDDVIMSHYYPFLRVHRSPVDFSHGKPVIWNLDLSFIVSMKKLLNEQTTCWKFETPLRSCKVTVISFVPFAFSQAKDEAKRLRSSAADQRRSVSNMESKISRYKREISKLRSERENKEQELGKMNLWTISQHWKPDARMGLLRFSRNRLQRERLVSGPGMHHGTCITHVPWCMSS